MHIDMPELPWFALMVLLYRRHTEFLDTYTEFPNTVIFLIDYCVFTTGTDVYADGRPPSA
jgi:hypothetical protein